MITKEQTINAVKKANELFTEVHTLAVQTIDTIGEIFASVDENFMYKVFKQNNVWDKMRDNDDYYMFDDGFGVTLRNPDAFNAVKTHGHHSLCYKWSSRSRIYRAVLFGDGKSFPMYLLDIHYYMYTSELLKKLEESPDFYEKIFLTLVNKMKEMMSIKETLLNFNQNMLKGLAEYVADKYNMAVELEKKNNEEFESLFGPTESNRKVTITVTINVE